ncbi:Hypothetical protein FKW44_017167 [Caligus rogercresseyi]|uniref:Uncharacterized protein n=1 Tax=Caligus rogercresseyi TaxID=217165 RepID=A0A7T8H2Y9_CALRO|nr:Hypothetical protein FKW44_017167 [Caligus rogercresseyi]
MTLSNKSVIDQTGDYEAMANDLDTVFEGIEDAPRSLKAMQRFSKSMVQKLAESANKAGKKVDRSARIRSKSG